MLGLVLVAGCGGGGGGSSASSASGTSTGSSSGTSTGASTGSVDFAQLARDVEARKQAYLQMCVAGAPGAGEGTDTQIARLELNAGPIDTAPLDSSLDLMDRRGDTADFGANSLLRLVYLHGSSPLLPSATAQRIAASLVNFKYGPDEPGSDGLVSWSENHQLLFPTAEYLAGTLYPQTVFPNAGLTGAQHAAKARAKLLRWLDARARRGFSEWYSPVYYEEDIQPLFNLVDFAPDADIAARAAQVLDLVLFDLARLTNQGSFGVTAGRAYEEHKWTGWNQSTGDLIEILFGTRGRWSGGRSGFCETAFATSRNYKVPHVLLGIGRDRPARLVDRSRSGLSFSEAASAGVGFQSFDDGMFWWGMGAYFAPETIILSRRMITAWDLWTNPTFQPIAALRSVPESLLPILSDTLSPLTEGSVLSSANTCTFRTPDAMLSSVQSYRRGQVGYQQHAWQATLGMDAVVFTTSPGTYGRDGPGDWTGSGSLPRVVQVENVAAVLYNPPIGVKALFPRLTHAFFPLAAFDEVTTAGPWTCARKGDGYVGLYSALPTQWQTTGPFAGRELVAPGDRNIWLCVVGRRAEDGPFASFVARLSAAAVTATNPGNQDQTTPLAVRFDAPGLGALAVDWSGTPTLNGTAIQDSGFPRYDNPYIQAPWGARQLEIRFAGAVLRHDHDLATRSGDGL
ncbi:MAG TPA: hypothetical protein VHF22_00555 [Planctomycetota bacterium]|nr:hypothetical protein [Planctomycetota bacterium]